MTSINLIPWREELREERKKSFLTSLVFVVLLAALVLLMIDRYYRLSIDNQNDRNEYLTEQIEFLDIKIVEIRELRQQKEELAARMSVIQNLQGARPVPVHLVDQLIRTLPDGVYYSRINKVEDEIRLEGIAESNYLVSTLMEVLNDSEWFDDAELDSLLAIDSGADGGVAEISFILKITVIRPDQAQLSSEDQSREG